MEIKFYVISVVDARGRMICRNDFDKNFQIKHVSAILYVRYLYNKWCRWKQWTKLWL